MKCYSIAKHVISDRIFFLSQNQKACKSNPNYPTTLITMPKRSNITSEDSAKKRVRQTTTLARIPENSVPLVITTSSSQGEDDDQHAKFQTDSDDDRSFVIHRSIATSPSMKAQNDRLVQFFGPNTGIDFNTSDQDEYIEFKSLLNVPVGPTSQPDVSRIIKEITNNPSQSILLSAGCHSLDLLKKLWRTASYKNEANWKEHGKQHERMQVEMEQLLKDCDEVKKSLQAVQLQYELHENKVAEKRLEMQHKQIEVENYYELGVYFNTLYKILRHFADDDNWSDKDALFVRARLKLVDASTVSELSRDTCYRVLNILRSMNYGKCDFFKKLWALPPKGYTVETWKETYGNEPKVLVAHSTKRQLQIRICDYVGLPTESLFDPTIPEDATEEQLERMRLAEEEKLAQEAEKRNKRYEALKAKARARLEQAKAERLLQEANA